MAAKVTVICLSIVIAACGSGYSPTQPLAPMPAPEAPVRITRIGVGESVRIALGSEDYIPFDQYGDDLWRRELYVTSNETVTVESRVVVDDNSLIRALYVGSNYETGKNCKYGSRSITCTIRANTEIPIIITAYPGPATPYLFGIGPAVHPTFMFIAQQVEP